MFFSWSIFCWFSNHSYLLVSSCYYFWESSSVFFLLLLVVFLWVFFCFFLLMLLRSILISMFIDFHSTLTLGVQFLEETRGFVWGQFLQNIKDFSSQHSSPFPGISQPKIPCFKGYRRLLAVGTFREWVSGKTSEKIIFWKKNGPLVVRGCLGCFCRGYKESTPTFCRGW